MLLPQGTPLRVHTYVMVPVADIFTSGHVSCPEVILPIVKRGLVGSMSYVEGDS